MPCDTKVMVNLEDNKWNAKAREKLGLSLKGGLSVQDAADVRVEAGKLKTAAVVKAMDPTAIITGLTVGSKKIIIQMNVK
jgi:hypothetical protein